MNEDRAEGEKTQFLGRLKEAWGKLMNDDIALYEGQRDQFLGRVQEEYGLSKEHAEARLKDMEDNHAKSA